MYKLAFLRSFKVKWPAVWDSYSLPLWSNVVNLTLNQYDENRISCLQNLAKCHFPYESYAVGLPSVASNLSQWSFTMKWPWGVVINQLVSKTIHGFCVKVFQCTSANQVDSATVNAQTSEIRIRDLTVTSVKKRPFIVSRLIITFSLTMPYAVLCCFSFVSQAFWFYFGWISPW